MLKYEVKYFDKDKWEEIQERAILEALEKDFIQTTKILNEMLHGKVVFSSNALYRIKNEGVPA